MAEATVADALVRRIGNVLVGANVHHAPLADGGHQRAGTLAVAAANAHDLMLVRRLGGVGVGCQGRHGSSAYGRGTRHGCGGLEKASAGYTPDRGLGIRHSSSFSIMKNAPCALPSPGRKAPCMSARPLSRAGPSPLVGHSVRRLYDCRKSLRQCDFILFSR